MITLSDQSPFAEGGNRHVYIHPQDENKCIKILRPHKQGNILRAKKGFPHTLRSANHYDENMLEEKGYHSIEKRPEAEKNLIYKHIPCYYGLEKTNIGNGSVTQLLRDYDGCISQSFEQRLLRADARSSQSLKNAITEFRVFLQDTLLLNRKLQLPNVLSVRINEEQERLYIIDGIFSCKEWIPLAQYIPIIRKKRFNRYFRYFDDNINKCLGGSTKE